MIACIIIEDQPPAQRVLQRYIADLSLLELKGTFSDALEAMEFLKRQMVDLIFLDIHLPKLSGIDFINVLYPKPKVIFTTAFPEYALKGYELDVVDYLLKPFSFERFIKAVSKVNFPSLNPSPTNSSNEKQEGTKDFLFAKSGHDYLKIEFINIQYIQSDGDYTKVFMADAKPLVSHSLKYWMTQLPKDSFCQIHKSFVVNIHSIQKVSGNQAFIGEAKIPIGRAFRDYFFENYLKGSRE